MVKVFRPLPVSIVACAAQDGPTFHDYKEGRKIAAEDKTACAVRDKQMAADDNVIAMMPGLQAQVLPDGEKEAAAYKNFSRFCKDTTAKKIPAIQKGTDDKESLDFTIDDLNTKRDNLDKKIGWLETDI